MIRTRIWTNDLNAMLQFRHTLFQPVFPREKVKICKIKKPDPSRDRASLIGLAVTYFRMRMHTIIGANPFHGPVRDGKAWFQVAIAAT